jgi:hypothetical protein
MDRRKFEHNFENELWKIHTNGQQKIFGKQKDQVQQELCYEEALKRVINVTNNKFHS